MFARALLVFLLLLINSASAQFPVAPNSFRQTTGTPPAPSATKAIVGTPIYHYLGDGFGTSGTFNINLVGTNTLLVVTVRYCTSFCGGTPSTTPTVSDGVQTCVPATGSQGVANGQFMISILHCKNNTESGSKTFTVNTGGDSGNYGAVTAYEISNCDLTAPDRGIGDHGYAAYYSNLTMYSNGSASVGDIAIGATANGSSYSGTQIDSTGDQYLLVASPGTVSLTTGAVSGELYGSIAVFK